MKDRGKTKEQLMNELAELRQRIAELEAAGAECKQAEEALRSSEARYKELVETSIDMVWTTDLEGNFLFTNNAFKRFLGYSDEVISKKNRFELIHPDDLESQRKISLQIAHGESVQNVEYRVKTQDGRYLNALCNGSPIFDTEGKVVAVLGVTRDITERKRAEEELRLRAQLLDAAVDSILVHDFEGNIVYANEAACKAHGYSKNELLQMNVFTAIAPSIDPEAREALKKALTEKQMAIFESSARRKDGPIMPVEVHASTIRSSDRDLILSVTRDITERKRAEEELKESVERLRRMLEQTVDALASMIEQRDPYTAGHQRRVTRLACAIAEEMGLREEQVEAIRIAGTLHDIGKINVPTHILSKPGKLSNVEMALIKTHPQSSYDIVRGVEFLWPVGQIILQHHERLDSSGYPAGLSGEEIVLEARVLAVADVVEAMSSRRPYRAALGIDKALEEISQNRGVLYDAKVVDACLKLFTEKGFKLD